MNLVEWLKSKFSPGRTTYVSLDCGKELYDLFQEYRIRELCFWICVNMIANAFGRCEFRTFINHKEVFGSEYFLWNFDPSRNENSTAFLHHLIAKLYEDNEVLIIETAHRDNGRGLVVADEWKSDKIYASQERQYTNVKVGETSYRKTFREDDVLHLRLNNRDMKPVIDGLNDTFEKLIDAAMKSEAWRRGQHWKIHVKSAPQGDKEKREIFRQLINEQFKPFLNNSGAVLPEFDGYEYTNVSGQITGAYEDIKALFEEVFDMTARCFGIDAVLVNGKIEGTANAEQRFLTRVIDPLCDQLSEEITRKRYGFEEWRKGNFVRVDSSSIEHFDMFANAASVEKLVGSGAFTINDVLRAAGQPQIDETWANEHYLTKNIGTVGETTRALEG